MTRRLHAASGLVFVVFMALTAALAPPPPTAGSRAADMATFYAGHVPALRLAAICAAVATLGLIWFAAVLAERLPPGRYRLLCVLGAGVAAALLGAGDAAFLAAAVRPGLGPAEAAALGDLQNWLFTLSAPGRAIYLLAAGFGLRAGGGSRLAWPAVAAGVLQLPALADPLGASGSLLTSGGTLDVLGFAAILLWTLAASIWLIRSPE